MKQPIIRCPWAASDPIFYGYHDNEWGIPEYNSSKIFNILSLEIMQAGLSWRTVLLKRQALNDAFAGFVPEKVVKYTQKDIQRLMEDSGIIRNRRKIEAIINNAKCYLKLEEQGTNLSQLLWDLCDNQPRINGWQDESDVPSSTPLSANLSQHLKSQGFAFIGPTIAYSLMQAIGVVNDHLKHCYT